MRQLLKGLVNAYMLCEAIALYETVAKYGLPELQFVAGDSRPQYSPLLLTIPIAFTVFLELITYLKVLRPLSKEPLEKHFVTKQWVNALFLLSFVFVGFATAGGVVALALLAIILVVLEK